jgi:hypothetical protein
MLHELKMHRQRRSAELWSGFHRCSGTGIKLLLFNTTSCQFTLIHIQGSFYGSLHTFRIIHALKNRRVKAVAAGHDFSLVLDEEGVVFSFGRGQEGASNRIHRPPLP